jgi:predicted nucleotidyltransferase
LQWPSKRLGLLYSSVYSTHKEESFSVSDVRLIVGDIGRSKVYLHRLKRLGWVYPFPLAGRGSYRAVKPEAAVLLSAGKIRSLQSLKKTEYTGLILNFCLEALSSVEGLLSLVLFGSVARGTARRDSDVDILAVIDDGHSVREAFDSLIRIETERVKGEIDYLARHGVNTHISILPLSSSRLREHPPILLDVVEDGISVFDTGIFETERKRLKKRLAEIGARRVFLAEDDWYWDLIPDYRQGSVVEL